MNLKSLLRFLCLATICFVVGVSANAQGVIIPNECRRCPPPPRPFPRPIQIPNTLPIKSIKIDTKISGQVATTHVEQIFRNDTPMTLEGTYFFPIPETAAIVEFAIWDGDKKLVGEVRGREEARRIYDEIVRKQRDPGLLEYAGKDLFQASIFPIPANSDKKLELTYSQVLKAEGGTVGYKYPLGTGARMWSQPVPIPRVEVDDSEGNVRRQNPAPKIGTVSGRIEIIGKDAIRNIYSPSHSIDIKKTGENKAVMTFESTGKNEQQDFQLFYALSNSDFGLSLVTSRETSKDGYFLMILSPKDNVAEADLAAKDIVFVLDTSGSMADAGKMEKARSALQFGIKTLRSEDRFNVINFAGEEHLMESRMISANSDGKRRGEEFVNRLQPTGGTNINDALHAALKQFDNSSHPKMLVFMTDGLPTVGETDVKKIIQNAKDIKVDGLRLFTFGVGYDVNTQLLDKLADENDGTADYIEPKENLEIKVSNFFQKVSSPVLTDIEIDFGGLQTDLIYPRKMPDLFKGSQITLLGRYKNGSDFNNLTLRVRGKNDKETRTFNYPDLDFPLRNENNDFLPRLWATRRVGWLMEQIRSNGEQKELRDEVIELGTKYGIVTPYTSYLALEANGNVPPGFNSSSDLRGVIGQTTTGRRNPRKPSSAPSGKASQATVDVSSEENEIVRIDSGASAVRMSKDAKKQKEAEKLEDKQTSSAVQNVGNKTFYLDENGVWIDSEFKTDAKLTEVKLQFASEAYFNLIKLEKDLAQYFSLGEQVVVVLKGKVYRITK